MNKRKLPLWRLLLERGFFEERKEAASWVMSNKVLINGTPAVYEGEQVREDVEIAIKGYEQKYVGKGGLKLEGALEYFQINVSGKIALDTGASTGGFTDCLLQHGVAKVYAIDAGYGQLAGKLRLDPRVVNMEKTNIGSVAKLHLKPEPEFATLDLSYLSLKQAIPLVVRLLQPSGEILCLVKPLFEVADPQIRRSGRIDDPGIYQQILMDLVSFTENIGLRVLGITHSPVTGNKGTKEFFLWLGQSGASVRRDIRNDIDTAVSEAAKLKAYSK
ncbi:TlyA family RNA methyltransferase [Paenibacillus sp. alder61]|uniref:TlyA family RNA methyltransferase n=1 Tax=Paenibacillus sp. alder61 TaxID=2862948 RepID=UPI001CD717D3|nr:TlyA family RNA methyltransferase [Paenibacillus sp. alder61]MCA1291527.1 TlyA family RNA methyltransferase [Paenibacillus sp. alder61]